MPEEKNQRSLVAQAQEEENKSHTDRLKAVILAGGKGTRAKPFTDYFPKAMMPINGKPLISYIVKHLSSFKMISEIIIVADLKGLGGQIQHYFDNKGSKTISFVQDSSGGTAGDLLHLASKIKEPFVLWFADNLCALDVQKMYKHFAKKRSIACIATRQYRKEETGFAKVSSGNVIQFIEKPLVKMQDCECTGIYILDKNILDIIKKSSAKRNLNLSYDVLQNLSKKNLVSSFDIGTTPWVDVESPAVLERKRSDIRKIIRHMS